MRASSLKGAWQVDRRTGEGGELRAPADWQRLGFA